MVFDSKPEFRAMLNDSFPSNKEGFMVFIDKNKRVLSSSSEDIAILSTLDIDNKFVDSKQTQSVYEFLKFQDTDYVIASTISKGYREYKTDDNYQNDIFALAFLKI
ncbi:MAG: hypothetical protein Q9M40_13850 [Sulfurimonas sp.]|nr:hypothetical protein [Sulfurimonas sp.]